MDMPMRHKHMKAAGERCENWLDRRPAIVLSDAAKRALAGFLAQASLPPPERENAQCRPGPSDWIC